jgi:Acetyltransferase (GNAT) domain
MPAQLERFYLELWDNFATCCAMQLLLAESEGIVLAGMILFASGKKVRYAYGASDERYLYLATNNLLLWWAIKLGCTQGYQTFDPGRMELGSYYGAASPLLLSTCGGLAATAERSWKFRLLTNVLEATPITSGVTH